MRQRRGAAQPAHEPSPPREPCRGCADPGCSGSESGDDGVDEPSAAQTTNDGDAMDLFKSRADAADYLERLGLELYEDEGTGADPQCFSRWASAKDGGPRGRQHSSMEHKFECERTPLVAPIQAFDGQSILPLIICRVLLRLDLLQHAAAEQEQQRKAGRS